MPGFEKDESLLEAPELDNISESHRGFWARIAYRLRNQIGAVGDIDGGGLQDPNPQELNILDGGEDLGDGGQKPPAPKPLDDAQVVAYLKSKGLDYENLEQITNQRNSVSGQSKKIKELSDRLSTLQKHPKYAEFVEQVYSGKADEVANELPPELNGVDPNTLKLLKVALSHYSKPMLESLKQEVFSAINATTFASKHDDFDQHEEKFVSWLNDRGISARDTKNLDWAYKIFLQEQESTPGEPTNQPAPHLAQAPKSPKLRQIGISPKTGARGVKPPKNPDTDEEFQAALDEHYANQEGG